MGEVTFYIKVFVGIVSVVDPLGVLPVFIGLTEDFETGEKRRIIRRTSISVVVILLLSAYIGEYILSLLGIDVYSFKIAGGIVLLMMSLEMLQARRPGTKYTEEEHVEASTKQDIAVVPLALPLLAGPGAISTVIMFSHRMHSFSSMFLYSLIIVGVGAVVYVTMFFADELGDLLGNTGMNIANRIMGLLLAAISVQFILEGLLYKFPILGG